MFEYITTEKFDIGAGFGKYEYDFFTINDEEDFWNLIKLYSSINRRFNYYLDDSNFIENNEKLSPVVKVKMGEHCANVCLTFLAEEYIENNFRIRKLIVNVQDSDGKYHTHSFKFYFFARMGAQDYLKQGIAYAQSDMHNAAIKYFSYGIKLDPKIAHLYLFRGLSYQVKGKNNEAKIDFSKALELNPEDDRLRKLLDEIDKIQ